VSFLGMGHKIIFALIPLILSIGIVPAMPFVDASDDRDAETQCRENQVLVFRFYSNNYVCVSDATATKWVRYGMAEIVGDTFENEIEEPTSEEFVSEETQIENEFEELNAAYAIEETAQPNIIVIMPDDVGWYNIGATVNLGWPVITNLRLDPFERAGFSTGSTEFGSFIYYDFFVYEFWRFVLAQNQVEELAESFIDYPPMQESASFNLDSIKQKLERMHSLGQ